MSDESIYNLVPEAPQQVHKGRVHRSKHDPNAPPTYSTFPRKEAPCNARDSSGAMMFAARSGVIGRDVGPEVDPKRFLKAHSSKRDKLPEAHKFDRPRIAPAKETVPTRDDKPVMGLMTEKNFVHANAIDAMCSTAKRKGPEPPVPATQKADFGKKPAYLERVKSQIDAEKTMLAENRMYQAEHAASVKAHYVRQVDEEERERLIGQLRARWEEKHAHYQSLPFARDTEQQIARKEALERDLKEIEAALEKLSKKVVVVYRDTDGAGIANWAKSQAQQDAQVTANTMVRDSIVRKRAA